MTTGTGTGAGASALPARTDAGPQAYSLDCVVMDTETTGMNPADGARLIEVATVEIIAGTIEPDGWSTLVNPGRPIPADATRVHGITDEMVKGAPLPADIASGLRARLGAAALAFHNAPFDLPFLRQFFEDGGAPGLEAPVIDTLGLARSIYGTGRNGLSDLSARLGMPKETAHRALGDARMTARVLIALAGWHERHRGIKTLAELAAHSQDVVRSTSGRYRK